MPRPLKVHAITSNGFVRCPNPLTAHMRHVPIEGFHSVSVSEACQSCAILIQRYGPNRVTQTWPPSGPTGDPDSE